PTSPAGFTLFFDHRPEAKPASSPWVHTLVSLCGGGYSGIIQRVFRRTLWTKADAGLSHRTRRCVFMLNETRVVPKRHLTTTMATDRLQTQRFELKYLVKEETARAIRRFVSCHLQLDEFAAKL